MAQPPEPAVRDADMTVLLIRKLAGVGAGAPVAQASWLRVLADIRSLAEERNGPVA